MLLTPVPSACVGFTFPSASSRINPVSTLYQPCIDPVSPGIWRELVSVPSQVGLSSIAIDGSFDVSDHKIGIWSSTTSIKFKKVQLQSKSIIIYMSRSSVLFWEPIWVLQSHRPPSKQFLDILRLGFFPQSKRYRCLSCCTLWDSGPTFPEQTPFANHARNHGLKRSNLKSLGNWNMHHDQW